MLRLPPVYALLALVAALALAGPAAAQGLAPPGACAEPPEARVPPPPLPDRIPGDQALLHFDPSDVAAPLPSGLSLAAPDPLRFGGAGSCDRPGSGCLGTIMLPPPSAMNGREPSGGGVVESPAGPGRPPGIP